MKIFCDINFSILFVVVSCAVESCVSFIPNGVHSRFPNFTKYDNTDKSTISKRSLPYACIESIYTNDQTLNTKIADHILDSMFYVGLMYVQSKYKGVIKIPDFNYTISTSSHLNAYNGTTGNFSTVFKPREYVITNNASAKTYEISTAFDMKMAEVLYKYHAKYGLLYFNGDLKANIYNLKAQMYIKIHYSSNPCNLIVKPEFSFEDFDIHLTGMWLVNSWTANYIKSTLKPQQQELINEANRKISENLQMLVNEYKICEMLRSFIML